MNYLQQREKEFDEKFPSVYFHNVFQNKGDSIFRDEVYPVDVKAFLTSSLNGLLELIEKEIEGRKLEELVPGLKSNSNYWYNTALSSLSTWLKSNE